MGGEKIAWGGRRGESEEHGSLCLAPPSSPHTDQTLFSPSPQAVAHVNHTQVLPSNGIHASAVPTPLLSSVMGRQVFCQGVSWAANCLSVRYALTHATMCYCARIQLDYHRKHHCQHTGLKHFVLSRYLTLLTLPQEAYISTEDPAMGQVESRSGDKVLLGIAQCVTHCWPDS